MSLKQVLVAWGNSERQAEYAEIDEPEFKGTCPSCGSECNAKHEELGEFSRVWTSCECGDTTTGPCQRHLTDRQVERALKQAAAWEWFEKNHRTVTERISREAKAKAYGSVAE